MKIRDYPNFVCRDCAEKAGGKLYKSMSCWHMGICDVCKKEKELTQPRDFGYPKFKKEVV